MSGDGNRTRGRRAAWAAAWTVAIPFLLNLPTLADPPFVGVNAGAPISGSSILFTNAVAADIAASGCRFVRINFIDAMPGWDATRLARYDQIIANARNNNLEVLAIFSNETVAGYSQAQWNQNYNTTGLNGYITQYASVAYMLINRYKDDVKLYELWNEPSCWAQDPNIDPLNPGCSYIWPRIFANLMAETYKKCIEQGGPDFFSANGVSLVSGGLFAHDIGGSNPGSATYYAHNTYLQTDIWDAFESHALNPTGRRYPWDYFGYHFYIQQGSAVSTSELAKYFNNVSGSVYQRGIHQEQLLRGDSSKILVTEFGWTTQGVGDQGKADNLTTSFNWMRTQSYIAAGMWYQYNCCDPNGDWGLTRAIGNYMPAWYAFAAQCGVAGPPSAAFSAEPLVGLAPLTVSFTDESMGTIDTYAWSFGDTGTSALQNPSHVYNTPGNYTVGLTVTGPGGSDTETKSGYITVKAVQADFTASPTAGVLPLTVQFTSTSAGPVASYLWSFGDGQTSSAANPSHEYTQAGTYTVSLTVTGGGGSDTKTRVDYIAASPNRYDLNADDRIDLADFAIFAACYSGPGGSPPAGCEAPPTSPAPSEVLGSLSSQSMAVLQSELSGTDLLQGRIGILEAGGFHSATPGGVPGGLADLTDGVVGVAEEAVLLDFPGNTDPANRALQVRYDFDPPRHLDQIKVFSANPFGRVFQNYDVEYSQPNDATYQSLATKARAGNYGDSNPSIYTYSRTTIRSTASDPIAVSVDSLRFTFYPVSGTDNGFRDPFDPGEPGDQDGYAEAFESSVIKEIDVYEYTGPLTGNIADFTGDDAVDAADYLLFEAAMLGPS